MAAPTATPHPSGVGITLPNGSHITSGTGTNRKTVFSSLGFPVTMNELWPGTDRAEPPSLSFGGQLGLIDFDTSIRLPRHVHIAEVRTGAGMETVERFIHERILVLQGVALVEMNGEIYVVPPRSLVTIAPGVPHTWTACPAGIRVGCGDGDGNGDGVVSNGTFLMVYEYEDSTSFRPTRQTETLGDVSEYVACDEEELDSIRMPKLDVADVLQTCWFVYNKEIRKGGTH